MSEAYAPDDAALRLTAVRSENGVNPLCLWARLMYVGGGISVFVKAVCSMLLLFTRSDLMRVLIRVAEVDLWGMIIFQSLVGYLDSRVCLAGRWSGVEPLRDSELSQLEE